MDPYILAFSLSSLGPKSFIRVVNKFGNTKKAWEGSRNDYAAIDIKLKTYETFDAYRKTFDIDRYIQRLKKENVLFISCQDKKYPKTFRTLEDPPIGIFCKGNSELLVSTNAIAVVGTRKVTEYGKSITQNIVAGLVDNGCAIVSGLALGVDAIAHREAVARKGHAIAVLACGVDCCLPSENYNLYQDILKNDGLILSEYPLSQPPNKGTFLSRNRLVAALSDGVLVTEAAYDSGSLVTANWGMRLGKKVFAVPGPITSKMSDGSLKLLKNGATLTSSAEDILNELKIKKSQSKIAIQKFKSLDAKEKKIIALLENEEMTIDLLLKKTKLPISILFGIISGLEIKGIVESKSGTIKITLRS